MSILSSCVKHNESYILQSVSLPWEHALSLLEIYSKNSTEVTSQKSKIVMMHSLVMEIETNLPFCYRVVLFASSDANGRYVGFIYMDGKMINPFDKCQLLDVKGFHIQAITREKI